MKINLLWIAVIAELRFMKSSTETETAEVTGIVKIIVMILTSEKWLFEMMMILSLTNAALAAATVQNWWYLNCCSSSSVLVKIWTCL